jgi:spermidine/putrescine transport system permease protein
MPTTDMTIWYGRLTTMPRLRATGWLLASAGLSLILLLLVIPTLVFIVIAFMQRGPDGEIDWTFTFDNFKALIASDGVGYMATLWRSFWIAAVVTGACLALAYPLAFFIAACGPRWRQLLLALVVVPLCTNIAVRIVGWRVLLSSQLPFARLAAAAGFIEADDALYPGVFAVILTMISCSLPLAVLPIYTSVERMDWSLVEAARDLYASGWRLFRGAILPQTLPGAVVAVIFTFVPAMGMFVVSEQLGFRKVNLIGNLIQDQFTGSRNYPKGSAMCLVLVGLTLAGLWVYRRVGRKVEIL